MIEHVTRATAHEASDVFPDSHADYPAFTHVFPDRRRRRRALHHFFRATVDDAVASGVVTGHRQGERYLAAAIWLPPGAFPWSPTRKIRRTPRLLRVLLADPSRFQQFMAIGANAERQHPTGDHWYLVAMGVRPEAQGDGLGTRLLEEGLARADEQGTACYLETSDHSNVAFYQRFGFHLTTPRLQLTDAGPTHSAMWRPPPS